MTTTRETLLQDFVSWAAAHITGDEKGQAQIFLDRLFTAFGQKGSLDVGGTAEMRIRKDKESGGGTSFADYVWKPVVLIEMKKRGADLSRHYRQAFDYWVRLVPDRPQYVVLCNFDEFWVYDFNTQLDSPKDKVKLTELATRWGPLAFLFPTNEAPTFENDREAVTREAADYLATCFKKLIARKVDRPLAQRFILQTLVALFAEDIGLLPRYLFKTLLDECQTPADSYDILGGLFEAMNTDRAHTGGRYKGVRYFNGGIFAEPARVELHEDEINQLKGACRSDWSKVSPDIFGAIFQDSMEAEERHAFGAHYTSPVDIMKIVKPTISDPWTDAIESAKSARKLNELLERLTTLRVLDPACGSGNFLYLAYREMKRLETRIRTRLTEEFPKDQPRLIHVNARQFFGLDISSFAIELAKVSMMIGRKLAIDELHIADEKDLPLDNLDRNFQCVDALMTPLSSSPAAPGEAGARIPPSPGIPGEGRGGEAFHGVRVLSPGSEPSPADEKVPSPSPLPEYRERDKAKPHANGYIQTPWPPADVIIGNPPFLGAKRLKPERGARYVNALRKLYKKVPGMADYCVYWIRRAHDHLPGCTKADSFVGRAGLVGTQNIRNNKSRVGGLDHVVATGTIIEAVNNQPWSGDANVHVSIVNWLKTQDAEILPTKRKLWFEVAPSPETTRKRRRGTGPASKEYELNFRQTPFISPSLSDETSVASATALKANRETQRVFQGVTPGYNGFVLTNDQRKALIHSEKKSEQLIRPYMIGRELASGDGKPRRFLIDANGQDLLSLQGYSAVSDHLMRNVLPKVKATLEREKKKHSDMIDAREEHLQRWWTFWARRSELRGWLSRHNRVIAASRTQRIPFIFTFISTAILPGDKLQLFAFDDDYSFGIVQSIAHSEWYRAKGARLKNEADYNYSSASVFDTFSWPQSPSVKQIESVASAAVEVRRVRGEALKLTSGGLRAVYRTLELPGRHPLKDAHAALDAAVLAAYGFDTRKDLLAQLLELNLLTSAKEKAGEPVTAPGVPAGYKDAKKLITADCIRP